MSILGLDNLPQPTVGLTDLVSKVNNALSQATQTAAQTEKAAKDFEAVLLTKVLQEMDKTIPKSGLFDSQSMKQVQSMFWSFLADDMADKGGFGLWKQVQTDMTRRYAAAAADAPKEPKVEVSS